MCCWNFLVFRNLGTIPDQQWKGIPDTKIYTFDENKKIEKSQGKKWST